MEEKKREIKVFASNKECKCSECKENIQLNQFIALGIANAPICLYCADLGYLVYLPSGNVALTRRANEYSPISAVVYKFSKSRKRNERQGTLVSEEAILEAEDSCNLDEEIRLIRRTEAKKRRALLDKKYIERFTDEIVNLYPCCPDGEASQIANHACEKYSGRVGRTAAAKEFDSEMIILAVRAHIRHCHTDYDRLLQYHSREDAREKVIQKVDLVEDDWKK